MAKEKNKTARSSRASKAVDDTIVITPNLETYYIGQTLELTITGTENAITTPTSSEPRILIEQGDTDKTWNVSVEPGVSDTEQPLTGTISFTGNDGVLDATFEVNFLNYKVMEADYEPSVIEEKKLLITVTPFESNIECSLTNGTSTDIVKEGNNVFKVSSPKAQPIELTFTQEGFKNLVVEITVTEKPQLEGTFTPDTGISYATKVIKFKLPEEIPGIDFNIIR